ncbi:MAG: transcription elongation factor GreA [Eubacteriales bacterium]|jgi:transcription elongation factor GreA|nr:transcription elongation factor GreA [Eubacteriales bacterium]MDD4327596.1 transcription elongation factor GreA [Eubacteriales bacterium]MDD4717115.1 transcription elongation factor GreA [Eubacteriales bacterium]NCU26717.1 transcription elongation factor GreA [Candidatus Nomurabacteria bacterium]
MAGTKIYEMTYDGIRKLEDELEMRKVEMRSEIAERIKQALSFGDISENSEYDDAKNAQGENEARIMEIESILKHAKVIEDDEISKTKVKIGAVVKLKDEETGEEDEYTLVSSKEADLFENKISTESPVGSAILGKSKGQTVDVRTPSGTLKYKIVKISKPK